MLQEFSYLNDCKITIKYSKDNNNVKKVFLRLEQLKRYLSNEDNCEDNCIIKKLVKLTFDNCAALVNYYYSKCAEKDLESDDLSDSMLKYIFSILDNMLMYCYALNSYEYTVNQKRYLLVQNFLQNLYEIFDSTESLNLKVFVLPFKGDNSLKTEQYFSRFPKKDIDRLGMSIEEISKDYNYSTMCIVLDPHNSIMDYKLFIPLVLHEISHHIKIMPRNDRNQALKTLILKKISDELTVQFLSRNSNEHFNFLVGLPRREISNAIYDGFSHSFDDFLETNKTNLSSIRFVDFNDLFKSYLDTLDFGAKYEIIISKSSNRVDNIKSEILKLQKYLRYPISTRFDSIEKHKDKVWYLDKLFCTMFYDVLFENDISYWEKICVDSPTRFAGETDSSFHLRCKNYDGITELLNYYHISSEPTEWEINTELFKMFNTGIIDQLTGAVIKDIKDFNCDDILKDKLIDIVNNHTKESKKNIFQIHFSEFEMSMTKIFETVDDIEKYSSLLHKIVDIKQHLLSYECLCNAFKERTFVLQKYNSNKELALYCYSSLKEVITNSICDRSIKYIFLLTPDLKDVYFRIGLLSDNGNKQFNKCFDSTLNEVGKTEFTNYIEDQINLYKEAFGDLFMSWTLGMDANAYSAFFEDYRRNEDLFFPKAKPGNDFTKVRNNTVTSVLNSEYMPDNSELKEHFAKVKSKWDELYSKDINELCSSNDYYELFHLDE